jgi:RNA polymerase sigma-70 factor (ECF subfamily)
MHLEEDFKTLILPLYKPLYRFARSFLADAQESEDCVQDIFLKLWLKRASLGEVKSIKAFAMQMTRNLCLDRLKGRRGPILDVQDQEIESDVNLYRQLESADLLLYMEKIIAHLPEQQRTLMHLRNVEGLEMAEIAVVTNMNIEHVRVTLSRARMTIRQLYEKQHGPYRA